MNKSRFCSANSSRSPPLHFPDFLCLRHKKAVDSSNDIKAIAIAIFKDMNEFQQGTWNIIKVIPYNRIGLLGLKHKFIGIITDKIPIQVNIFNLDATIERIHSVNQAGTYGQFCLFGQFLLKLILEVSDLALGNRATGKNAGNHINSVVFLIVYGFFVIQGWIFFQLPYKNVLNSVLPLPVNPDPVKRLAEQNGNKEKTDNGQAESFEYGFGIESVIIIGQLECRKNHGTDQKY